MPAEERKLATVLFADLVGSTELAGGQDPERVRALLDRFYDAMAAEVGRAGGTVEKFVGDAVMAVFGAPFPQPDHADHSALAAAAMHSLQAEINARWAADGLPAFGLGIGLSTGEAAAALLGSEERLEYTLVGDTVNLSQRLQQLAAAGETVLSEATSKAMTVPMMMVALPAQLVKGRDAAIVAYKITQLDIPAPAIPRGLLTTPEPMT